MRSLGWFIGAAFLFAAVSWAGKHAMLPVDAPVLPSHTLQAHRTVPRDVQAVLANSCIDCHSQAPRWPWYARLPIVSGWVQGDMRKARHEMNLSNWDAKIAEGEDEEQGTLNGMCEDMRTETMPPRRYLMMHRARRPSAADIAAVCRWTESLHPIVIPTH